MRSPLAHDRAESKDALYRFRKEYISLWQPLGNVASAGRSSCGRRAVVLALMRDRTANERCAQRNKKDESSRGPFSPREPEADNCTRKNNDNNANGDIGICRA